MITYDDIVSRSETIDCPNCDKSPYDKCYCNERWMEASRQLKREALGKHKATCRGYNERPCDCGLVDDVVQESERLRALLCEAVGFMRGFAGRMIADEERGDLLRYAAEVAAGIEAS